MRCSYASLVATRPLGVRARNPMRSRYGSYTSSTVSRGSLSAAALARWLSIVTSTTCIGSAAGPLAAVVGFGIVEGLDGDDRHATVEREALRGLLPEDGGSKVEEAMMNWFEREMDLRERRGESKGESKAERRLLLKLLRLRFGELPAAVVARIEAAEVPELEAWGERFVTASRLEDVLGPIAA